MTIRSLAPFPLMRRRPSTISLIIAFFLIVAAQICSGVYYGKLIGKLSELHHGVSGEVYAVDARTLFIKDFTYDGEGPAAFFYAGNSKSPGSNGFRMRDERGTTNVLKRYRKKDITLTLPDGKTLNNIKWFSVWCDEFSVNFGDVKISRGFDYPKPQKLKSLSGIHGVSSEPVVIVDAQTLLIPSFSYDGEAPDAKFWVGIGLTPSPQGIRIPDENGKEQPLRRYDRKTIVLTLPGDLTVHQFGHFGVWCEAFAVDFGHVQIPQGLNIPPSLKMLGVSPQSKLNCEVLDDSLAFEVRWAVAGDSIVVQLVAKLDAGEYMAFGLSADTEKSVMIGGDVAVAWVDKQTLQGYAVDYFLDAKSQCSGRRGSCPDKRILENTDSVRLLNAAMVNGYSIVTYQRPLRASDELDHPTLINKSQAIIWAIGPLNERQEVSFHSRYLKTDRFIEFGRPPAWNCPMPDQEQTSAYGETGSNTQVVEIVSTRRPPRLPATPAPASTKDAWEIPPIQCNEPDDGVFYAQMGPTGGKHGYPAITGHVGWGISWYINGLLIPVINVVRGRRYTFVVEGGSDLDIPARYHPFYITDDPIGGYQHKTAEEKAKVKIFAGILRQRGKIIPTGTGRLCNWVPDQNQPPADDFASFGAYQRTLTLECDHGEPGFVEWTPDENTPNTVYYQCFTHRYLGWKINVLDSCDLNNEPSSAASEKHEVYMEPAKGRQNQLADQDLEYSASIAVASKQQQRQVTTTHEQPPSLRVGHLTELGREQIQQQTATNQQLSNLVADHQRSTSLNHGTKLSYVGMASGNHGQLPNSQEPHFYTTNYHHVRHQLSPPRYHHQHEPPRAQLMIIRRPVTLTRRPMLQTLQAANMITSTNALSLPFPLPFSLPSSLSLPSPPRSIFIERKKSVYRPPAVTTTMATTLKTMIEAANPSLEKSAAKIDTKQQLAKLEAKIGSEITAEISDNLMDPSSWTLLKPARNTGFDPDSIVIEGGFKPIIRNIVDNTPDVAQKRADSWREDDKKVHGEGSDYRTIDEFSTVFMPSLPVVTSTIDSDRKRKKKTSPARFSPRLDDFDDMEMAADLRLDTYYLPPIARTRPEQLPSPSSSGVLITYDGKKLKDSSSLARSISNIEHHDSKDRLTSELLSRTPQFGKFQGELPPLIPGEMRTNSYERQYHLSNIDLSLRSELLPKTRLTLVERSKRSSSEKHRTMSSINFQQDNSYNNNHGHREREQIEAVSGGGMRVGNLGSIILITIVVYCVI
ncbi:protein Skeletor, isoforms B/C isoform X2 [Cataglyphis hispanica]|uniref:protein Skeletor, isoforms B/C isoform X2 n=1 Tax=Cataglyphis hispanica TaxID=1086592 RepID=UPI0021809029|nr:protein Skeletor, isoforms B/C isoform X2 [Cataglyphis hispanica]